MLIRCGRHLVRCGDALEGMEELLSNMPPVDLFYSDPPWGEGHLLYWQTMNAKMCGAPPRPVSLERTLTSLFDLMKLACRSTAVVCLEYGLRWEKEIRFHAARVGLRTIAVSRPTYGKPPRPLLLFTMAWRDVVLPPDYEASVSSTTGLATPRAALKPFAAPGLGIFDPYCGMGYTAKVAVETGMTFFGNELNRRRLDRTVARLEKG